MTAYLRLEVGRALRDVRYLLLVIAWPVASYLLFSTVFGSAANSTAGLTPAVEIMVAMAAFGAIGSVLMATGPRLAGDRRSGWLRQLGLSPLTPVRILAVRSMAAACLALPAVVLTLVVAATVRGVALAPDQWILMGVVLVAGSLPFVALGMAIGCVADGDMAQGLSTVVYLALSALGGLWMPVAILPAWMRTLAHVLPSYHLAALGWAVARGAAPSAGDALVLGAWLVGLAALAALAARRVLARA